MVGAKSSGSMRPAAGGRVVGLAAALAVVLAAGACGGGGAALPTGPGDEPGAQPGGGSGGDGSNGGSGGGGSGGGSGGGGSTAPSTAVFRLVDRQFVPEEVTIAVGGTVTWEVDDNWHEVLWQGAAPPGGDIGRIEEDESATRTFPVAGTYRFRCDRHDDTGVVHVLEAGDSGDGGGGDDGGASTATVTTPGVSFSPATVTIAAGGTVTWVISGTRHNVTFRGTGPPGGNIPDTDEGRSVSRAFPSRGTYDYDCTRHSGMSGRVVVQ